MEIQLPELELWKMTDCVSPSDSSFTVLLVAVYINYDLYYKSIHYIYVWVCIYRSYVQRHTHKQNIFLYMLKTFKKTYLLKYTC